MITESQVTAKELRRSIIKSGNRKESHRAIWNAKHDSTLVPQAFETLIGPGCTAGVTGKPELLDNIVSQTALDLAWHVANTVFELPVLEMLAVVSISEVEVFGWDGTFPPVFGAPVQIVGDRLEIRPHQMAAPENLVRQTVVGAFGSLVRGELLATPACLEAFDFAALGTGLFSQLEDVFSFIVTSDRRWLEHAEAEFGKHIVRDRVEIVHQLLSGYLEDYRLMRAT